MENNKNLLNNIHNLVTFHYGQNYLFNACMQYLMECLNESKEYDYWFFSGVTGDSFTQLHRKNHNEYTVCLSQDTFDENIAKKAFDACGYDFIYVDEPELRANQDKYIEKIVTYIDKGIPVITRGCEGIGEFSVICGYEDNGDTFLFLKGDETTPTPYKNNLTCRLGLPMGLVFVGGKKQAPPLSEVYRTVVMDIPSYLTKPSKNGLSFGRQAFIDWADSFMDGRFNNVPIEKLDVWKIHGTYLCMAGTNGCSRGFLKKALELNPDMDFINIIEPIFAKKGTVFEELQNLEGGFSISPEKFKNKEIMRPISEKIRQSAKYCDDILKVFASLV